MRGGAFAQVEEGSTTDLRSAFLSLYQHKSAATHAMVVQRGICEYAMNGAYSEVEGWVVDVDDNTTDGSLIVTIRNPRVYIDFWCDCCEALRKAAHFLNVPSVDSSLRIGSFCGDLAVELNQFEQEPDVVYLSVTRQDEQSMAYSLTPDDCRLLANAIASVIEQLDKNRITRR